ncbi:MAG: hypothetical protein AB7G15_10900 [Alphaproteobacteria bacterium]
MKIVVVATRSTKHTAEEFAPLLAPEAKMAMKLWAGDFIRELYARKDGKGAVLVCEAVSEEEARQKLGQLPLVQKGMLTMEFYPVGPYRAIVQLAEG